MISGKVNVLTKKIKIQIFYTILKKIKQKKQFNIPLIKTK